MFEYIDPPGLVLYWTVHKATLIAGVYRLQRKITPLKIALMCLVLVLQVPMTGWPQKPNADAKQIFAPSGAEARDRIAASPELPFHAVPVSALPPYLGWESGAVSWLAVDKSGTIYELQRGEKADPVLVLDRTGKVLRSWGKGDFNIPHSIRLDPHGNVWTVDSGSSKVIEYSPLGAKLMTISVGQQPENGSAFHGATDIAFGPTGRIFIADGYGNARILEYAPDGKRVREWGKPGTGPGEFHLPHAIEVDGSGTLYVADRENGRIEKVDLDGHYLGEIAHLGRVYSLKLEGDVLWATLGSFEQPPGSPVRLIKLDRVSGRILGHFDVSGDRAGHCLEQMPSGELVMTRGNELVMFEAK